MNSRITKRVLIVEDDESLAEMVAAFLHTNGMDTTVVHDGVAAIHMVETERFDAVLLDVNLPRVSGFDVLKKIRNHFPGIIFILTARGDEEDEIHGIELGADDYLAKPVRPAILLARLKSHFGRRTSGAGLPTEISVGDITINQSTRTLILRSAEVALTTAEFDLLWLLALHAGTVVSRQELSPELVGLDYIPTDRSIDLRITRLRRKLGDDASDPKIIKSIRGRGYMLAASDAP